MYLSEPKRKEIIKAYGGRDFIEAAHYQVEPDVWVYLFYDLDGKKYVLVVADYLGDFEFDHFPQLLRFDNDEFRKVDFVLQKEIPTQNLDITTNSILFECSDTDFR